MAGLAIAAGDVGEVGGIEDQSYECRIIHLSQDMT
jgi:hypothetical protein